jgi:hypothetical protein
MPSKIFLKIDIFGRHFGFHVTVHASVMHSLVPSRSAGATKNEPIKLA